MSKFKVGDRVVIVESPFRERIGQVARVLAVGVFDRQAVTMSAWGKYRTPPGAEVVFCTLDLPSVLLQGCFVSYPEQYLELYRDGDSRERAAWSDLPAWARRACKREVGA